MKKFIWILVVAAIPDLTACTDEGGRDTGGDGTVNDRVDREDHSDKRDTVRIGDPGRDRDDVDVIID